MKRKSLILLPVAILVLLSLAACNVFPFVPQVSSGQVETAVVQTAQAQLTQISINTLIAQLTQIALASPTPSQTPVPPTVTATATSTSTVTSSPTATATVPSATPSRTSTVTPLPVPCLSARYIADVTVPDNTILAPNQSFTKTWRLQNSGSCAWTPDFDIVFVGGNVMSAPAYQKLNATIYPGQTIDLSLSMIAPAADGAYKGDWKLRAPTGVIFGLGGTGSTPFWVKIVVQSPTIATSIPGVALDFAASYCQASWTSGAGSLGCPGSINDFTNGSVGYTITPKLEGGYQDDEPAVIMIPSNGSGGFINGRYPAITVQSADRFQALIGCLDASPNCNVMFQLNYSAGGGAVQNLGTWTEVSDGNKNRIDLPVGSLAGQSVQFILYVNNNNGVSVDDRFFLLAPVIRR